MSQNLGFMTTCRYLVSHRNVQVFIVINISYIISPALNVLEGQPKPGLKHERAIMIILMLIPQHFLYPPRNIIDQALAHCSHSLLQPPRESGPYCISTQLYILSTSQRSSACRLLSYQQPNLTKQYNQRYNLWVSRICLD